MRQMLALAVVLGAASAAWAGDLKVGKGAPFPTIQSAVDAAADGDRILVARGVCKENVTFMSLSNVQFLGRSATWDGTLGAGQSGPCLSGSGNGILVQGFKFRHGESHVVLSGGGKPQRPRELLGVAEHPARPPRPVGFGQRVHSVLRDGERRRRPAEPRADDRRRRRRVLGQPRGRDRLVHVRPLRERESRHGRRDDAAGRSAFVAAVMTVTAPDRRPR